MPFRYVILAWIAATTCSKAPFSIRDAGPGQNPEVDLPFDAAGTPNVPAAGQLIVMKEGTGRGLVTSAPGGINCGGTCVADFASPTLVTLSAIPDSRSVFAGWAGECQGQDLCTINVRTTQAVTATFTAMEHTLVVSQTGEGRGVVTSFPTRIECVDTCSASFEAGLTVILTAAADGRSIFTGWSGRCHGRDLCTLVLDADQEVVAHFDAASESLHVAKAGTGTGRVRLSPVGIDCGETCAAAFAPGRDVILVALPDPTSIFTGWSGACGGTESCPLRMSAPVSVTAHFDLVYHGLSINKTGSGSGMVQASPIGIASAHSCASTYPAGTLVTLTATPDESSVFAGWSGACSGFGTCTVTMDSAQNVDARFEAIQRRLSLTKVGAGSGIVFSVPSGLRCGDRCEADFVFGAEVVLQATPQPGAIFAGWSGACAGEAICTVVMDEDRSVTAEFR